jgi:tetratricopeptide (TPR) repeat protein
LLDGLSALVESQLLEVVEMDSPPGSTLLAGELGGTPFGPLAGEASSSTGPGTAMAQSAGAEIEICFRQLETVRAYALEQLQACGEAPEVRRRHAWYYLSQARAANRAFQGPHEQTWLAILDADHANLRDALGWAAESNRSALGLELSGALWRFWRRRGHLSEGRRWLGLFLSAPGAGQAPLEVRADALTGAARLASGQDDFSQSEALFQQALQLYQELGQNGRVAEVTSNLAVMARNRGRYDDALALVEQAIELGQKSGDLTTIALLTSHLGLVRQERGELDEAETAWTETLERRRALGDRKGVAAALAGLGVVSRDKGDVLMAEAYCSQSLDICREVRETWATGYVLNCLAVAVAEQGDLDRARELLAQSLDLFQRYGVRVGVVEGLLFSGQVEGDSGHTSSALPPLQKSLRQGWPGGPYVLVAEALEEVARVMVDQGDARRSALMLAMVKAWRRQMGSPVPPYRWAKVDATVAAAQRALGAEAFSSTWKEGQELSPDQAVLLALAPMAR